MRRHGFATASPNSSGIGNSLDLIAYAGLWAFIFSIPWEDALPMLGGFVIGRWLGLLAFGVALLRVAVTGRSRKPFALHYWMLALVGWSALSLFWTVDWDSTITRLGTYLQLLTAVWLIWELGNTEPRVVGLLKAYVFGTYVSGLSTIANLMMGRTASLLLASKGESQWDTSRYTISGFNENDLGLMLALSIPMTFYLLGLRKGKLLTMLCWLQLVVCVTAILLTGSRGALLAATAGFVMFPLIVFRLPRLQKLAAAIVFPVLLACGAFVVPAATWNRILAFTTEVSQGTLTHRTVIWSAGLEAFRNHAFLGVGSGAYAATVLKVVDVPYVAHNTFLSVLVELGVVGALLLFALLGSMVYCALRMKYLEKCLWITLLLTWAIGVSSLTWEYRKTTWILFGLIAAHTCSRREKRSSVMYGAGSAPGFSAGALRPRFAVNRDRL